MRTSNWTALSALALALTVTACGDDKGDDDTTAATMMTTTVPSTMGTTMEDPTTGVVDPTNDSTTTTMPTTMTTDSTTTTTMPTTMTTDPTTTTDPATTDPDTDSTTGGAPVGCQAYCDLYKTACVDFAEYDNDQACLDECAQWPEGEAGAVTGDSLGCRAYHVGVASMVDAAIHCPHAGPSGAGECVDPNAPTCDAYCTVYFSNCKDDLNLYDDDMQACLDQCAPWYPGKKGDTGGNSIGCRDYHAGVALGDPGMHCPHAGPGGAGVCVYLP